MSSYKPLLAAKSDEEYEYSNRSFLQRVPKRYIFCALITLANVISYADRSNIRYPSLQIMIMQHAALTSHSKGAATCRCLPS